MKVNVVIVGVGGQGVLTTSHILARAAMLDGFNVVSAETHGMAQRGGSVEVHLRIGDVKAPLCPYGSADYLASLEPVESLRYCHYLNTKSKVIINTRRISPPSVSIGLARYPDLKEIVKTLREFSDNVYLINASDIAEKCGNIQATNVVIAGALIALGLPLRLESVEKVIEDYLPPKLVDLNVKALREGYNECKKII